MNEILAELERLYSGYNPYDNERELLNRIDALELGAEIEDAWYEQEQYAKLDKQEKIHLP